MSKPQTQKEKDALLIRKQKSECKLCDGRGYTFTIDGFERKAKPCECTTIKKPEVIPSSPFKDDMGDIHLN